MKSVNNTLCRGYE